MLEYAQLYLNRIGLGFYNADIHPYKKIEYLKLNGDQLVDGKEKRPDIKRTDPDTGAKLPINPVYIPFNAIYTSKVSNLLVPGYAMSVSSYSWGELRVLPNQCVTGDAAGIITAFSINNNVSFDDILNNSQLMESLRILMTNSSNNVRLEK